MTGPNTPPGDPLSGLAALLAQRTAADEPAFDPDAQIRVRRAEAEDKVRSFVTRWVVVAYLAAWGALLIMLCIASFVTPAAGNLLSAAADVLMKVALPVVTLVLGYYFGSARQ